MRIALITSESMSGNIVFQKLIEKHHEDIISIFIVPYFWNDSRKNFLKMLKLINKSSLHFCLYKFLEVYFYRFYIKFLACLRLKKGLKTTCKQARFFDIPYKRIKDVNSDSFISTLKELNLDYVFSYCPQIYKQEILKTVKNNFINTHGALLPEYRGAASYFWCVMNREPMIGFTIHNINTGIDAGEIYHREEMPGDPDYSAYKVNYITIKEGAERLPEIYSKIRKQEIVPVPQDESKARYYSLATKDDMRLFFRKGFSLFRLSDIFSCI